MSVTSESKQTAATQNTAPRIELDNRIRLWYNAPMPTATETTPTRILPQSSHSYAYAFGYLCASIGTLSSKVETAYYIDAETRLNEIEEEIAKLNSIVNQLKKELES